MKDSTEPNQVSLEQAQASTQAKIGWRRGSLLALLLLGGWAYWPTVTSILETWSSNPDYSHGFFVIPIAVAFLWTRRDLRPNTGATVRWEGLALLALAGALRFAAGRFYLPELDGWSIPLWLGGLVLLFYGTRWFLWAVPSIIFLWFATPLPASAELFLSIPLQHLAATTSSWTLRIVGQPAIAEGTTILLNEHVLDIERACSGLRMFYGIAAMAVACVIFLRMRGLVASLVLLGTVPIAIVANVFRITLTGLLLQNYSGETAGKISHDLAGYLMIPFAVLLFIGFAWWLLSTVERLKLNPGTGARWVSIWFLAAGIGIGSLVAWGHYQQRHVLTALLEKADQYESEHNWRWAVAYLQRYLQASPNDPATFQRYAEVYEKAATTRQERLRSVSLAHRVWKQNPSRADLAENAAQTAYELGETRKAIQICESLLNAKSIDHNLANTKLLYANALLRLFEEGSASEGYSWDDLATALDATRSIPTSDIHYEVALAHIWQEKLLKPDQESREEFARAVMDSLVEKQQGNPMAWLARNQFLTKFAPPEDQELNERAKSDLSKSLELVEEADDQEKTAIYIAAATLSKLDEERAKAEDFLKLAIELSPQNSRPYVLLSELKRTSPVADARQEAIDVLLRALEKIGEEDVDILLPLATMQTENQDWQAAAKSLEGVDRLIEGVSGRARSKLKLGAGIVRARILREHSGPYAAIRFLESIVNEEDVRIHQQLSPKLFARACVLLGRLYRSVDILDRASEQYRTALQLDPSSIATRTEALAPVLNSGDLESAELLCRQLLREAPDSEAALITRIRANVRRQLRQPIAERDWTLAERAFKAANNAGVAAAKLLPAEIELLESQGETDQARKRLAEALEQVPHAAALWRESALLLDRLGELDQALKSADKYVELLPSQLDPVVLKATLLEKANQSEQAQTLLESVLEESSGTRWIRTAQELARLQLVLGKLDEAESLLEEIHRKAPENLLVINTRANLAWATGDWDSLARHEKELRKLEGEAGTLWRFHRAQRLLEQATSTLDPLFEDVNRLNHSLQDLRPRWSKTSLLQGNIALRSGKIEAAILAYQRAWDLGDRSALVADRLIELLTEQGREREAKSYVLQVRNSLSLSRRLFDRAIPYYLRQREATALKLAEAWAVRRPLDSRAHLRLGRVHLAMSELGDSSEVSHLDQAKQSLRKAVELAPQDIDAWITNVTCEKRLQGPGFSLEEYLNDLATQLELTEHAREFALAQVYEVFDRPLAARAHYRTAARQVKDQSDSGEKAIILGKLSAFHLEIASPLAERFAREAMSYDDKATLPRHILLQVLTNSNDPAKVREALALASAAPDTLSGSNIDFERRIQAKLLSLQGEAAAVDQAIELLETLLSQTIDDQLLLASLYERKGRTGPAFGVFSRLASSRNARPRDYVAFLEFWQKHFLNPSSSQEQPKFAAMANAAYQRLRQLPAQQAEWLRLRIQQEQVPSDGPEAEWSSVLPRLNELLEINRQLEQWGDAAKHAWCRSMLEMFCREKLERYAYGFVQETPTGVAGADAAIALCHAMILTPEVHETFDMATDFLLGVQEKHPQRADLARATGDYLLMSGRYESAVEVYLRALAIEPQHKFASNNLALALAEIPGRLDEAIASLEAALREHGPDPILLDTRAVLELLGDRPEQALSSLKQVMSYSRDNAAALLHTAMAYQLMGEQERASESYIDALSVGLKQSLLSLRDREFCLKMSDAYLTTLPDGRSIAADLPVHQPR